MEIKQAYNIWSDQYDTNENRTRDLEAIALRNTINKMSFENCLEIGCGTGKNTTYLISKAKKVTAVDFSDKMLDKAKEKIKSENIKFIQADITQDWTFISEKQNLITFSLVLEHIKNLDIIFMQLSKFIDNAGYVYIGELHPFKQYAGAKARFDTDEGVEVLTCYNHHISDFTKLANKFNFEIIDLNEYFDDDNRDIVPRIISLLLRKK